MAVRNRINDIASANGETRQYSSTVEARRIFDLLTSKPELRFPPALSGRGRLDFTSDVEDVFFPIPFKETETTAALKALEAGVAAELASIRYGDSNHSKKEERHVEINLEKVACFLCASYLSTIDGFGKLDPRAKKKIKDTDLLKAQSIPYRRMSANLYKTKEPNRYYHIHGSLEATKTLNMIGLPGQMPDLTEMDDIIEVIESHVEQYTVAELEDLNAKNGQAGVEAMKHEDFLRSSHGEAHKNAPPWTIETLESSTPPAPFPIPAPGKQRSVLNGIKVLELCRVIAGPTMGRILAEYGASVLKITSPNLPDVPFFQVDGNMSKHCAPLDLKDPIDRAIFDDLLADADVVLDGYRPGALELLGYGPAAITKLAKKRGKGFVYVNENCFGYRGSWAHRPGWQQIADCVSGVAWAEGQFLGLDAPMVPPFPMSDYGTGCMGAVAALTGLYHRAKTGGSYHGQVSLLQYDLLLFEVGQYSPKIQDHLLQSYGPQLQTLRHHHSVDHISHTVSDLMHKVYPQLFDAKKYRERWWSEKYDAEVVVVKPVPRIEGLDVAFERASRPNGSDRASWDFEDGQDKNLGW